MDPSTYTAAQEFLETAYEAVTAGRYRPFIDNLFSAVELMSRSLLLSQPEPRNARLNHRGIATRINKRRKANVIGGGFAPLLNQLADLRHSARYDDQDFHLDSDIIKKLRIKADGMLALLSQQIAGHARKILDEKSILP